MTTDEMTDAVLVRRAASGDEQAFRELYRAYVRPVYWVAHGLLRDVDDAHDVTQESFIVAWDKLGSLELASDSLLPWLVTICRFQAANRLRARSRDRARRAPLDDRLASGVDLEREVITSELADAILRETESLGELDRDIFRLCATEGHDYAAAARELGVTHATVRNRLSRVRHRLRVVVGDFTGS